MTTVYINIGSNQGDSHAQIEQAVALISQTYKQAHMRQSAFIESEPWGYESDAAFLNIGLALDFDCAPDPMTLLDTMQAIEREISISPHRNIDGSYRDRPIDIDIIAIDKLTINNRRLQLPHPRAHLREFVMRPLSELAPADLIEWISSSPLVQSAKK